MIINQYNFNINLNYSNMSYRQCRSLCEMLRSLNYNRLVSLQNFAKPNFELVADILYWLSQKYDPQSDISDDINEEKDRVEFMKGIVTIFAVKARIKLNPKKLYQADGEAVPQLLKIVSVLYKASNTKGIDEEEAAVFTLPAKVSNLKAYKNLSNEICDLGARLYDALSKEPELKKVRIQALSFLEGMSGTSDGNDQAYIESCIKTIMQQQEENTREMMKYVANMQHEQKTLQEKLKKKTAELERNQKRYRNLVVVKPAFMEEYERLEQELARLQQIYVNKYRNIDYLENELDQYNKLEEDKLKKAMKKLKKLQEEQKERDMREFKGDDELDVGVLEPAEDRSHTRGHSRKEAEGRPGNQMKQASHHQEEGDSELEDDDDNGEEEESGDEIEDQDDDSDF